MFCDDSTAAADELEVLENTGTGFASTVNVADSLSTTVPSLAVSLAVTVCEPAAGFHSTDTVCAPPAAMEADALPILVAPSLTTTLPAKAEAVSFESTV